MPQFNDVAVIEVLDGLVDGGEDLLGRADVVDGDRGNPQSANPTPPK